MLDKSHPDDWLPSDLKNLEEVIRSARNYVAPVDDLRPRVIEAAKEARLQRRSWHQAMMCFVVASVMWGLSWPCAAWIEKARMSSLGSTAAEIQQLAIELAPEAGSADWALVDAFVQSRSLEIVTQTN